MMKNGFRIFAFTVLLITGRNLTAQDLLYKDYDWDKNPKRSTMTFTDTSEYEIVLFEKRSIEYANDVAGDFSEFFLLHTKKIVNSDYAIENNNKIYLPSGSGVDFITIKVRTISPDGKVKELDRDDIQESKEEGESNYKYFALEGIQKGSEIEQLLFIKRSPDIQGSAYYIQNGFRKLKGEFELISPAHLVIKMKSLNGFPELKQDSTVTDRNMYRTEYTNLPAFKEEKFAMYNPARQGFIYKIHENKATGVKNIFSYNRIAEEVYNRTYEGYDKNKKLFPKFIKTTGVLPEDSPMQKVLKLEKFLKMNFYIINFNFPLVMPMKDLLSPKSKPIIGDKKLLFGSQSMQLFCQLFKYFEIEHQIVLTCDRFEQTFDKDFEAYNYLEETILYLPTLKMYLDPGNGYTRAQFINSGFYNNYGLFLVPMQMQGGTGAIPKVKFIDQIPASLSCDSLVLSCSLNTGMTKLNIEFVRGATGYFAKAIQPHYGELKDDDKLEANNSFTDFLTENKTEVSSIEVENAGVEFMTEKPFITKGSLACEQYVETAGEKYLIKVGELIGPQAELYQEEKRRLPIENHYNRQYYRRIEFTVPDGYKVTNLSILNMKVTHNDEKGKETMAFISGYKVEGNKVIITCTEVYHQLSYTVAQFEDFRKVINASADFNKLTLILEKS